MNYCFTCKHRTPNSECYIGTIENCPLKKTITELLKGENKMTIWKLIFGFCGSNETDREYLFSSKENAIAFCKKVTKRRKWELVSEDEDEGEVFIHFKQSDPHYPHVSALNRTLFCEIMPVELDPINY